MSRFKRKDALTDGFGWIRDERERAASKMGQLHTHMQKTYIIIIRFRTADVFGSRYMKQLDSQKRENEAAARRRAQRRWT